MHFIKLTTKLSVYGESPTTMVKQVVSANPPRVCVCVAMNVCEQHLNAKEKDVLMWFYTQHQFKPRIQGHTSMYLY